MPNLLPGEGMGPEGSIDTAALLVGDWSYVGGVQSGVEYEFGNVPEGVLEISREDYAHQSTAFPRTTDLLIPTQVGMRFTGQIQEIHAENMHMLVGDLLNDSSLYVYVGAAKGCTDKYFSFSAKRSRTCDDRTIEVYMWKVISNGLVSLGGGDEAVGSPFEVNAHDDRGASYGGSPTAPLGYLYVPAKNT